MVACKKKTLSTNLQPAAFLHKKVSRLSCKRVGGRDKQWRQVVLLGSPVARLSRASRGNEATAKLLSLAPAGTPPPYHTLTLPEPYLTLPHPDLTLPEHTRPGGRPRAADYPGGCRRILCTDTAISNQPLSKFGFCLSTLEIEHECTLYTIQLIEALPGSNILQIQLLHQTEMFY